MGQGIWYNQKTDLHPTYYRVTVDMTGFPTSGTTGGGVTPNPSEVGAPSPYAYSGGTTQPTTDAKALLRERGNMRWQYMVDNLGKYAQCQVMSVDITEANGDAQATSLSFTVSYERDAFNREESIATPGSYLTGKNCIKQLVADALQQSRAELRLILQPENDNKLDQIKVTADAPLANYAAMAAVVTVTDKTTGGNGIDETGL